MYSLHKRHRLYAFSDVCTHGYPVSDCFRFWIHFLMNTGKIEQRQLKFLSKIWKCFQRLTKICSKKLHNFWLWRISGILEFASYHRILIYHCLHGYMHKCTFHNCHNLCLSYCGSYFKEQFDLFKMPMKSSLLLVLLMFMWTRKIYLFQCFFNNFVVIDDSSSSFSLISSKCKTMV